MVAWTFLKQDFKEFEFKNEIINTSIFNSIVTNPIPFSSHFTPFSPQFHPIYGLLSYQTILVLLPFDVSPFYIDPGSSLLKVLNNWGINRIDNLELIPVSLSTRSSPSIPSSLTSTTTASNHLLFKKMLNIHCTKGSTAV